MDDLLDMFREATGAVYDGDLYGLEYNASDGQDRESDLDEDLVVGVETHESDDEVDEGGDGQRNWTVIDDLERCVGPREIGFGENVGPNLDRGVTSLSSPFEFYSLFVTPELLMLMVDQTNVYAQWRQERERKVDKYWKAVTPAEIRIYLHIQYMMGIHQLPEYYMYWSSDDRLRVPGIADPMGRSRYEKIHQYFHLNDPRNEIPRGQDGYDPLYKVRPLIDHIQTRSRELYSPGKFLSIDEAMIGFRGRLHFLQYMRGKPTPWGIKVWCVADPTNGFITDFSVYTGKRADPHPNGIGYQIVTELGRRHLGKGHHFFFDNYFASVTLSADLLHRHSTHSCSTIRTNRKGWPAELKDRATSRMKPGDVKFAQSDGLTATVWRDKRKVAVLSTNTTPAMLPVRRRAPGGHREVNVPSSVLSYNKYMFGVDLADQHRAYYNMGRSGMKWWRYVAWFLLQTAMVNSWVLYKMCNRPHPRNRRLVSQIQFRLDVCSGLVAGCSSRKRRAPDSAPTTVGLAVSNPSEHPLVRLQGSKLACFECRLAGRKTRGGRAVATTQGCALCKLHLCPGHCFSFFHMKLLNQLNSRLN